MRLPARRLGRAFEFRLAEDFPYYIRGIGGDARDELYLIGD